MSNVHSTSLGWLDPSCILAMDFDDGSYVDRSFYKNNGIPIGIPGLGFGVNGGGAVKLNGTNQYIQIPVSPDPLNMTLNSFTLALWLNTSISGSFQAVIIKGVNNPWNGLYIFNTQKLNFGSSQSTTIASNLSMTTGTWFHVVCTRNGTACEIYVNGRMDKSGTVNTWNDNNGAFSIGQKANANLNFFGGLLDCIRIYNRVLSPTEIWQLYEESLN